jgi:hypothetical protein
MNRIKRGTSKKKYSAFDWRLFICFFMIILGVLIIFLFQDKIIKLISKSNNLERLINNDGHIYNNQQENYSNKDRDHLNKIINNR